MSEQEFYSDLYNKLKNVENNLQYAIEKLGTVYDNLGDAILVNDTKIGSNTVSETKNRLYTTKEYIKNPIIEEIKNKMM